MNTSDNQEEINQIPSEESVARILSEEWFVKDKLLSFAFALEAGETYLSVNRPLVSLPVSRMPTLRRANY